MYSSSLTLYPFLFVLVQPLLRVCHELVYIYLFPPALMNPTQLTRFLLIVTFFSIIVTLSVSGSPALITKVVRQNR